MSEHKVNFIIAVRSYKTVKREKKPFGNDITALDSLNKKVLLRIIEPLTIEYVGINDVKNLTESIKQGNYDNAILVGKQFTPSAFDEISKQRIEYISEDYMPPFDIQELYLAIVECANNQCQKKCGKVLLAISDCEEKAADFCKIKSLAANAKSHFEEGTISLMKNDLKVALALNH